MRTFSILLTTLILPVLTFAVEPIKSNYDTDCSLNIKLSNDSIPKSKELVTKLENEKKKKFLRWSKIAKISGFIALASFGLNTISKFALLFIVIFFISVFLSLLSLIISQILKRELILTDEEEENDKRAAKINLLIIGSIAVLLIGLIFLG